MERIANKCNIIFTYALQIISHSEHNKNAFIDATEKEKEMEYQQSEINTQRSRQNRAKYNLNALPMALRGRYTKITKISPMDRRQIQRIVLYKDTANFSIETS